MKKFKRARAHTEEFENWLKEEVGKMNAVSRELKLLALGLIEKPEGLPDM